ncbi:putative quinol monooxygenase [Nocardia cyriacigeorgica]|uniref:putative quinol monooxygenase n=1 Tax=Nocardia cyriacigeorgica TaxID=135487 RepID=UPI002113CD4E|nr:putative quinol monooxygenase [Nocardia cyriacigeorgica]
MSRTRCPSSPASSPSPGRSNACATQLIAMIAPSLAEEGGLGYQPYVDPTRADRVLIAEEWTDAAALEHHFTLPHFQHVAAVLAEILAEPFTLRRLTDMPA